MLRGILNAAPLPLLLFLSVASTLAVVLGLVWLVRRIVPATAQGFHAEISAPMLGVVAALFGLLLAFVIIIAYQNYLDANANVSRESDALAGIVRDSEAFPEPGGSNVRAATATYVDTVVNDEWPRMHSGEDSGLSLGSLTELFAAFRTVNPRTSAEVAFYDDAVRQLNNALAARRDRLKSATGGLPRDIVILLLFSTAVIVGYAVLVGSPRYWFHALGPAAIAMVVAVSLVVLVDLSYPFSGDVSISPSDFRSGTLGELAFPPVRPH